VGLAEVVGGAEVGGAEVGGAEVGGTEAGGAVGGAADVGGAVVGAADVGAAEVGAIEVGSTVVDVEGDGCDGDSSVVGNAVGTEVGSVTPPQPATASSRPVATSGPIQRAVRWGAWGMADSGLKLFR